MYFQRSYKRTPQCSPIRSLLLTDFKHSKLRLYLWKYIFLYIASESLFRRQLRTILQRFKSYVMSFTVSYRISSCQAYIVSDLNCPINGATNQITLFTSLTILPNFLDTWPTNVTGYRVKFLVAQESKHNYFK